MFYRILGKLRYYFHRVIFFRKKNVLVLGDSHIKVFEFINKQYNLKMFFDAGYVSGATAMGLSNEASLTRALSIFKKKLSRTPKNRRLIIQLGEIDCGFLIWLKMNQRKESLETIKKLSLSNYFSFVKKYILDAGFSDVWIMSTTLPTIEKNGEFEGEISLLRKEVTASQADRTNLTLQYNIELQNFCNSNKIGFLDMDRFLLDKETGLIKREFLNHDPKDHHNNPATYAHVIVQAMRNHGLC